LFNQLAFLELLQVGTGYIEDVDCFTELLALPAAIPKALKRNEKNPLLSCGH